MAKQPAPPTRHVRIAEDLADMLGWINELEGDSANDVVDPLIRSAVERRYGRIAARVEAIKAIKGAKGDPAFANELAPDLGGEGG